MFRNFLYRFPYSVLWIFVSLVHLLRVRESVGSMVLYGLGNGVVWTFNEYLIHRLVLHHFMYSMYHKIHHVYWSQALFAQQWFIGVSLFAYYRAFLHIFGQSVTNRMFVFVPLYYVMFEWIHFVSHDVKVRQPVFIWVKYYHRLHHLDEKCNYGITTPLWDWVFGTLHTDITFEPNDIIVSLVPLVWFIRAPLPNKRRNQDRLN
jgi:sterol desaturase/sphingolipid hydroxylase (fatty acid hydroxylase superfamily)